MEDYFRKMREEEYLKEQEVDFWRLSIDELKETKDKLEKRLRWEKKELEKKEETREYWRKAKEQNEKSPSPPSSESSSHSDEFLPRTKKVVISPTTAYRDSNRYVTSWCGGIERTESEIRLVNTVIQRKENGEGEGYFVESPERYLTEDELRDLTKSQEKLIQDLSAELDGKKKELEEMARGKAAVKLDADLVQGRLTNSRYKMEGLQHQVTLLQDQNSKLLEEQQKLQKALENADSMWKVEHDKLKQDATDKIEELKNEKAELEARIAEKTEELKETNTRVNLLSAEVKKFTKELSEKQARIESLENRQGSSHDLLPKRGSLTAISAAISPTDPSFFNEAPSGEAPASVEVMGDHEAIKSTNVVSPPDAGLSVDADTAEASIAFVPTTSAASPHTKIFGESRDSTAAPISSTEGSRKRLAPGAVASEAKRKRESSNEAETSSEERIEKAADMILEDDGENSRSQPILDDDSTVEKADDEGRVSADGRIPDEGAQPAPSGPRIRVPTKFDREDQCSSSNESGTSPSGGNLQVDTPRRGLRQTARRGEKK